MVEDDPRIARPTARALEDAGHVVVTQSCGQGGWRAARSGEYDAVLLDVLLPGLDGFQVARTCVPRGWTRRSSSCPPAAP